MVVRALRKQLTKSVPMTCDRLIFGRHRLMHDKEEVMIVVRKTLTLFQHALLRRNVDVNSDAAAAYKSATYQGGYADLNFWITMLQGGVLGCAPPREPAVCLCNPRSAAAAPRDLWCCQDS